MASNNNSSSSSPTEEEADGESTRKPNWLELPRDVTENILQRLGAVEMVKSARNVCSLWWNICKDPLMWRDVDMIWRDRRTTTGQVMGNLFRDPRRAVCRYIVDQSRGHLEFISIGDFANDEILDYIAARASNLRSLELVDSFRNHQVSNAGVCAILDRCPLLESLHFDNKFPMLDANLLERCKEQVKDFRVHDSRLDYSDDESLLDSDDSYSNGDDYYLDFD